MIDGIPASVKEGDCPLFRTTNGIATAYTVSASSLIKVNLAPLEAKLVRRTWLAVLIGGLLPGVVLTQERPCPPRRHAKLPAITDSTYHKARKRLLAAGWQPVQRKSFDEATSDPDISYGNGRLFWRKGYVEVEACSGTGVAACSFLFKDAFGNRLRVQTAGQEVPRRKHYARVTGFEFVCM